ncbi:MAG: phosphodiester glycosidase family protein [Candidatus Marinimicrobia bacterium]|nr:phosphodiester glycosidase family protein [Candidatus Neomarinimicrobiota bacterium]
MKKSIILVVIMVFILKAEHKFITTETTQVGPGIVLKKIIEAKVPWKLNVLEIDLRDPYVKMETVKANDQLYGYERTSSMAARKSRDGHIVVAGINGDFYGSGGVPINTQVVNGQILKNPINISTLGFDDLNNPCISITHFSGMVKAKNSETNLFAGVNGWRNADQMILYNSLFGTSTGTNEWGSEVLVTPITDWVVNDTVYLVAEMIVNKVGNMGIPAGMAVISGHGQSDTFIRNNVQVGDTLKAFLAITPTLSRLTQLLGGYPRIIKDGVNYASQGYYEEGGPPHTFDRHPRTAAGFSADSSKLYLVTVDGRQPGFSIGMNLIELADFMIDFGVYHGINFDGGGSTTIIVRGNIENSPSDASERSVANGLLVVSSAPEGSLNKIQISPDYDRLFKGEKKRFSVTGWDEFFNPVSINADSISYYVVGNIGFVDSTGLFTATSVEDSGFLYVSYGEMLDSAFIYLKSIQLIRISPKACTLDTIQSLQLNVNCADEDGVLQLLSMDSFKWNSSHPDIGSVDSIGIFQGKAEGQTVVYVEYGDLIDSAKITVEVGFEPSLLDAMDSLGTWNVYGENINLGETKIFFVETPRTYGNKALKLEYSFTRLALERSWVYLNTDIPIYGLPESIDFDFKSDGAEHEVYVVVSDNNDELFRSAISGYATDSTQFITLKGYTSTLSQLSANTNFYYPIRFKGFHVKLGNSAPIDSINSGALYFDNLRVNYPGYTQIISVSEDQLPKSFGLSQNYPNPFNSITTIEFQIPKMNDVCVKIYNILGEEISELIHKSLQPGRYSLSFDGSHLASGVYIYQITYDAHCESRKMMLLK